METPTPTSSQSMNGPDDRIARIEQELSDINTKITYILGETQKSARARQITFWLTIIFFLGPLIAIVLMIPTLMGQLNTVMGSGI